MQVDEGATARAPHLLPLRHHATAKGVEAARRARGVLLPQPEVAGGDAVMHPREACPTCIVDICLTPASDYPDTEEAMKTLIDMRLPCK